MSEKTEKVFQSFEDKLKQRYPLPDGQTETVVRRRVQEAWKDLFEAVANLKVLGHYYNKENTLTSELQDTDRRKEQLKYVFTVSGISFTRYIQLSFFPDRAVVTTAPLDRAPDGTNVWKLDEIDLLIEAIADYVLEVFAP